MPVGLAEISDRDDDKRSRNAYSRATRLQNEDFYVRVFSKPVCHNISGSAAWYYVVMLMSDII